ncbi:hypothetical protein EDD21DRAFT_383817, partial [Dissophora ornata]
MQQEQQAHPDQLRRQQRDPQVAERQQEWGHVGDPAAQYGVPPQQSSRDTGRYGASSAPVQEPVAHARMTQYQNGAPQQHTQQQLQQQQLYPGQEHHGMQGRSPAHEPMHNVDPSSASRRRTKGQKQTIAKDHPEELPQRYHNEYDQYEQHQQQQLQLQQQQQQRYVQQQQERQEQVRHHPQHAVQVPQQQHHGSPYPPTTQSVAPTGRRSAPHSRNSSASGSQGLAMMVSPVPNPPSVSMDHLATPREHPMRVGSPGASGHAYRHAAQGHSRSRGSSPALGGYSQSSHGPMPIPAPVVSAGQRQGTHSRNSSNTYEMAPPRSQVTDPYMTRPGPGPAAGSSPYPSQPPPQQGHHSRPSMDYAPPPQQQQQPRHSQEMHPGYGHSASRSQDMSGLGVQQPPSRSHNRSPSEVYAQQVPVQAPPHQQTQQQQQQYQQQQQQQQYPSSHRHAAPQGQQSEPTRMPQSRTEQQWYQEQQEQQQHHKQYQSSQQHAPQQSYQQPGYPQHSGQGQPYHPSQGGQPGFHPSSSQPGHSSDPRYGPPPGQRGPPPGHHDPSQPGTGQGSGSQGAGASGGSRISLSSLL